MFRIHLFNHHLNVPARLLLHKSKTYPLQLINKSHDAQSKMLAFPCQISVEDHTYNTYENVRSDVEILMMVNRSDRNKKYII